MIFACLTEFFRTASFIGIARLLLSLRNTFFFDFFSFSRFVSSN